MARRKKHSLPSVPHALGPGSRVACCLRDSGHFMQERSVENQRRTLTAYCEERGWIIVAWFVDEAVQATNMAARDGFLSLVSQCHDKPAPFDGVVFTALDRGTRSVLHYQYYLADIRLQGIAVIFAGDNVPDGDMGLVWETFLAWKAEEELRTLARRVQEGQRTNLTNKLAHGGFPPVGYLAERVEIGVHRNGRPRIASRWVLDNEKAPLVRLAFQMRAAGHTLKEILEATNVHRSTEAYARMFRNKAYLGSYVYGTEEYPDAFPAIVERELWDQVQALPAFPPKVFVSQYLLSGLVRCGICGAKLCGHSRYADADHPKRYHYYVCKAKLKTDWNACSLRPCRAERLEQDILARLGETILDEDYVWAMTELAREKLAQTDVSIDLARLDRDVARTQQAITDLYDLAGTPRWEQAKQKMRELEVQLSECERRRARYGRESAVLTVTREQVAAYIAHWRAQINSPDFATRQRQLRQLVAKVTVKPDLDVDLEFREEALIWCL